MKNKFILFTGPSAVGKATIEKELFKDDSLNLRLSVSATTRAPREGEVDGVHYYFITKEDFDKRIENDEFIEWNQHFSNKYGTLKSEIDRIQSNGNIPFIEVEVIGAANIIGEFGQENLISIFIAPPSIEDLRERMIERGTETLEQIEERLSRVQEEMKSSHIFQHIVINDDLDETIEKVKSIIREVE